MKSAGGPHGILRFQEGNSWVWVNPGSMLSSALQREVAVRSPKDSLGSQGRAKNERKAMCSLPWRDQWERRGPGEQSQEERKEESFFKLIVCFTTPTPAWGGFRSHFHHRGNTCPGFLQESAPFLPHTSHSNCAHNKKWGLCGLTRGLVWRLAS